MADGAAFNAFLFGSTAQSLDTLHPLQRPQWWTEERIQTTVTVQYVAAKLKDDERAQLHRPLSFGDGLTSDTYLDFILERAKNLFLILSEIGIAGRIFSIIDLSYDDSDLPIPIDIVPELALSSKPDEKLNRRFHEKQYQFLLRDMQEGEHTDYAPYETVPIEYTFKLPADVSLHNWMRVRLARSADNEILARRRLAMASLDSEEAFPEEFFDDLEAMRYMHHDHIVPIWGSYAYKGAGYVLTPFLAQHSLKSFLELRGSVPYQRMAKTTRQKIILEWMHCLADALAYLHLNGFHHTAIRPSNIVIDTQHKIAFSDIGALKTFQKDKVLDPMEAYNYGAPEAHLGERYVYMNMPHKSSLRTKNLFRKRSHEQKPPKSPSSPITPSSDDGLDGPFNQPPPTSSGRKRANTLSSAFNFATAMNSSATIEAAPPLPDSRSVHSNPSSAHSGNGPPTEKSDIFSLGCVFLDMLSFLHKCKHTELPKYIRSSRKATTKLAHNSTLVDSSFHANLPRVHLWMNVLDEKAFDFEDQAFRAVPHLLRLVRSMLSHDPDLRPTAASLKDHLRSLLLQSGGFDERNNPLHCGNENRGWDGGPAYSTYPSSAALESPTTSEGRTSSVLTSSSRYASGHSDQSWAPSLHRNSSNASPTLQEPTYASCVKRESTPPNFSRLLPWGAFGTMPV